MGLRFNFPLIWFPVEEYQPHYQLCDYEEKSWMYQLLSNQGYILVDEDIVGAYNLTNLQQQYNNGT